MQSSPTTPTGFHNLGIAPSLLTALGQMGLVNPTPIQLRAIPIAIQGQDVVGIAQTGTGKTVAFGVPMLQRLGQLKKQGLVVLPTRELALQVQEALTVMGREVGLRTALIIGGADMRQQISAIKRNPHVIIATPGRLNDHLEQKTIMLKDVGVMVLDEADRMMDMGFLPQITKIFQMLPRERQTMLFSATMPHEIMKIASTYMRTPTAIEVAPAGTTAELVAQELFFVNKDQKLPLLLDLLRQYKGPILVFTKTKHGAKRICRQVIAAGHSANELHSNRSLNQRRQALDGFKKGIYRVLVATDIAARGIHVDGIDLVVNFDLPSVSDDYVHRIGRTARAGAAGKAISFAMPSEKKEVRDIERLIRKSLPITRTPQLEAVPAAVASQGYRDDDSRGGGRSFQGRSQSGRSGGFQSRSPRRDDGPRRFDGPRSTSTSTPGDRAPSSSRPTSSAREGGFVSRGPRRFEGSSSSTSSARPTYGSRPPSSSSSSSSDRPSYGSRSASSASRPARTGHNQNRRRPASRGPQRSSSGSRYSY